MKEYVNTFMHYRFLLRELVKKGIKLKYRRSYLGIIWSLLEPLLTMIVLTIVFGTLFGNKDKTFPVYILTGRLLYSYYSSSTTRALKSVRANAAMIKKVYVPKYIYPLTRIMSSLINMLISLIPLAAVAIFSGLLPNKTYFLLPFPLLCLALFCLGLGMLLASAMVFFRDIQFLWGVLITIWTYLTPIFYPVSALPDSVQVIVKMNPLYFAAIMPIKKVFQKTK